MQTTLEVARLLHADKIIFQCPASFTPTSENKDRMRQFFTKIERSGIIWIWEPRGKWQKDEVAALCQELNLIHCVDPFKAECVTDGLHYYRLHGITGYRHQFKDAELWQLVQQKHKEDATYFLFNNTSMYEDAIRFMKLLR